jgi:protein involved in polysaccharide export with SLBB domain
MDKIVGVKPEVEADLLLREGDMVILDQKEEPPPPRFSVLGAVAKGGTFDLPLDGTPVSIAQAVANAGGKNPNAALSKVVLQRKGEKIELNLYPLLGEGKADAPEGKYEMQDGDVLLIPEMQRKFMVMGAVNRPATYPLPEEKVVTVLQALSEAGGSAANANPGKATLLRMVNGKTELTKIDLYKMVAKGDTSKNFVIQDNDVLWVPVKGEKFNINEIINPLWLLNVMGISLFR